MKIVVSSSRALGIGPLRYRARIVGANGNTLFSSIPHPTAQDCIAAVRALRHPQGLSCAKVVNERGYRIN